MALILVLVIWILIGILVAIHVTIPYYQRISPLRWTYGEYRWVIVFWVILWPFPLFWHRSSHGK